MPLPTFATLDEIPEAFRSEYEERDGVWAVKAQEPVEKGATRKEIERRAEAALKRAREAEDRAQELTQELAAKSAGVAPEELQKVRAAVEAKYTASLAERDARIHDLTFGAQMNTLLADEAVDLAGARKLFDDRFELSEAGTLVPKNDKSVAAKQYLADTLRAENPWAFRGSQATGGDARGGKSKSGSGKLSYEEFQKLSPGEKQKYADTVDKKAA